MRRSVKCLLIGFLLMSVLTRSAFAQLIAASEKSNGETQKVIAVVLDDSTSMVRDDPGTQRALLRAAQYESERRAKRN